MRDGWTDTHLGEVIRILPGRYLPREAYRDGGPFPVFGSNSLMGYGPTPLVRRPCVVMAAIGANAAAVRLSTTPCWVNNNAFAIVPSVPELSVEYLHQWLASALDADAVRAGTGQPYVKREALKAQPISYPAGSEQARFVDLLQSIDLVARRAVRVAETARDAAPTLLEGALADADYPVVTLRELAVTRGLVGGPFGSNLRTRDYTLEGVPVINGANHSDWDLNLVGPFAFVSSEKAVELRRNLAQPGDIVATNQGTVGQVSVVPVGEYDNYVVSQRQLRLRVRQDVAHSEYIAEALRSRSLQSELASQTIQTGVPHINLRIFGDLVVPLPPMPQQVSIARQVHAARDASLAARTYGAHAISAHRAIARDLLSGAHSIPSTYDHLLGSDA